MDCSNSPKHDRILLKMLLISTHSCRANYSHCLVIDIYTVSRAPGHFTDSNIVLFLHLSTVISSSPSSHWGDRGSLAGGSNALHHGVVPWVAHISPTSSNPASDMEFRLPALMEGDRKHQRWSLKKDGERKMGKVVSWEGALWGINPPNFRGSEPQYKHPKLDHATDLLWWSVGMALRFMKPYVVVEQTPSSLGMALKNLKLNMKTSLGDPVFEGLWGWRRKPGRPEAV